jgi:hypothetical protein
MSIKNRSDLKSYFVKNAIPTEGNFADLIDSQLNQAQDGVFKPDGEALTVVSAGGTQKRALRLYADFPQPNPDWMISLNPLQTSTVPTSGRAGFGITDGAGNTRLYIDPATGNLGVGTNNPGDKLTVSNGDVRIEGGNYRRLKIISDTYWAGIELVTREQGGNVGNPHIDFTHGELDTPNYGVRIHAGSNTSLTVSALSGAAAFDVQGSISTTTGLIFEGSAPAHLNRDGALYRFEGQCYLTVDDHLYLRKSGATNWTGHFELGAGLLELKGPMQSTGGTSKVVDLDVTGSANLGYARRVTDLNAVLNSGMYDSVGPANDVPDTAHDWTHLLVVRHYNPDNNHQLQIASTFAENDRLFFRKFARSLGDGGRPGWNELATVTNGVLRIGDWTLESSGNNLNIKRGAAIVARFSVDWDRFTIYRNLNGAVPYFYYNQGGNFSEYRG